MTTWGVFVLDLWPTPTVDSLKHYAISKTIRYLPNDMYYKVCMECYNQWEDKTTKSTLKCI
jgi:hypothetical protein